MPVDRPTPGTGITEIGHEQINAMKKKENKMSDE